MSERFSSNTPEEIASKIDETAYERVKSFHDKIKDYSLVITGTVGSGKSTICESLSYLFSTVGIETNNFPEFLFVNDDVSGLLLTKKINGQISNVTFQNFVLDNWECILRRKNTKGKFNIFERCVDDSVMCFCNIANANLEIKDIEFYSMYQRLLKINETYDTPTYFDKNVHFTKIMSGNLSFNLCQILDIIESDLKKGINKRIIGLVVSDFDSKQRIKLRNRSGESSYDDVLIKNYNTHYKELFSMLEQGGYVKRFLDMGKLL